MPKYTPPPPTLDHLNPIQRYMQKGSLDRQDYAWLVILVLAYVALRPYVQKFMKWLLAPKDVVEGDQALRDHFQEKAKVGANTIRGSKATDPESITVDSKAVTASGSNPATEGKVLNRKSKPTITDKSEEEKLVDWDDEPLHEPVEGGKTDVMAWLDKWDKE